MEAPILSLPRAPKAGRAMAFDEIHAAYRPRIHRYLSRIVGPEDAEDVAQLVFFRASQALPDFRGESSLGTWLYRIARNAALDWRRGRARARATHEVLAWERIPLGGAEQDDPAPPADEALVRREMQECLRGVIAEMPEADRDVIALGELDGLPGAKVAETLGVSLANAKIRLHRARGRLRATLTDCCTFTRNGRHGFSCERKGPT